MGRVDDALQTQIRNIEARSGKTMTEWARVIAASGLGKHGEIVAFLKTKHAMSHGDANRTALVALAANKPKPAGGKAADPAATMYAGAKAPLLPIHEALLAAIKKFGDDIELAPKKGYVSLRRAKQFAMLRPAAKHVDVGLILRDVPVTERLESSGTFNAMFTHRVRVPNVKAVDRQLIGWLREAYDRAG